MNYCSFWKSEVDQAAVEGILPELPPYDSALDLGSGLGQCLWKLSTSYRVTVGIDIDDAVLDCLQKSEELPSNVFLLRADASNLPVRSESVTSVLAWGLLCQLPFDTVPRVISETARVLKQRGTALIGICYPLCPIPAFDDSSRQLPFYQNIIACLELCGLTCKRTLQFSPSFWAVKAVKPSYKGTRAAISPAH